MGYTSNIPEITIRMARIPAEIDKRILRIVKKAIMAIDRGVHDKTPVWSGLAIRNMIWSEGQPNTVEYPEIKIGKVENEGRRDANAAAARRSLSALNFRNPYSVWYLSNASHHIAELEAGQLPSPERSRVPPGGMFGLTYSDVRNNLRNL